MKYSKVTNTWINKSLLLFFFVGIKTMSSAQTTFNSLQSGLPVSILDAYAFGGQSGEVRQSLLSHTMKNSPEIVTGL
jgi:hypothetical protein